MMEPSCDLVLGANAGSFSIVQQHFPLLERRKTLGFQGSQRHPVHVERLQVGLFPSSTFTRAGVKACSSFSIVEDVGGSDVKEAPQDFKRRETLSLVDQSEDDREDQSGLKIIQKPEVTGLLEIDNGRRFICFVCDDRLIYLMYWSITIQPVIYMIVSC